MRCVREVIKFSPIFQLEPFADREIAEQRKVIIAQTRPAQNVAAGTPEPVLDGNPKWVELYWKSWENLQASVLEEKTPGPLPARVIAQNGAVEFDAAMGIALYARWGWRANPISDTLSFLLQELEDDGAAAARFSSEGKKGVARGLPLAALAVASLYDLSGDKEQLLIQLGGAHKRHDYIRSLYSYAIEPEDENDKPRIGYRVPPLYSALPMANEATSEVTAEAAGLLLQDAVALARLHRLRWFAGMPVAACADHRSVLRSASGNSFQASRAPGTTESA